MKYLGNAGPEDVQEYGGKPLNQASQSGSICVECLEEHHPQSIKKGDAITDTIICPPSIATHSDQN